jgi:putative glycosyltransferase
MDISVVTTMYRSAPYIEEFCRRAAAAARAISGSYEIVIVNDGSPDNALELAVALHRADQHIRVVDLSRNFGHHKALMTGLAHARGALVFLIDCDLEVAPELLAVFHRELRERSVDVVYGVQAERKDGAFSRLSAEWFYTIFNAISDVKLPRNLTTARLMTARYVQALVQHHEREVLISGLWQLTGFAQTPLVVAKAAKGSSTYSLARKLTITVNAITSLSNRPLIFIFYLGLAIVLGAGAAACFLVIEALTSGFLAGWPSLIVSVWLLGGLTIFCLGIIGIYLSKIFTEVKQRPYTIVRHHYDRRQEHEHGFQPDPDEHRVLLPRED